MFDAIRKHQKFFLFVLLLLILPALVLFGVSGYEQGNKEQSVAKVGDSSITKAEFERALQQQLEQFRQFAGPQADLSTFDTPELRKNLLENLIARKAAEQHAIDSRVVVSDAMVQQTLMNIPVLRLPDGSFDKDGYKARLAQSGQTPQMFEAQLKRDLAAQLMTESLGQSGFGSEVVRTRMTALFEEVRTAKPLAFLVPTYTAKVTPTAEQLKTYFDKNQDAFKTQESAKVEFVVLSSETIATAIALNADDVKTFYEQNKSRYGVAEQRRASHIFFNANKDASEADKKKAKDAAEAVLADLKKDAAKFEELAKTKSQDTGSAEKGGDLGFFTKDSMVAAVVEAAAKLKEGQLSDVVQSEDGFHIVKLTGVRAGETKPFETVKAEIEADLKKQQATKKFAEASIKFTETVYSQGDSLKAAADEQKLTVQTAVGVSRSAPQPGAGPVLSNPKVLRALFSDDSIKNKKNIEAVEIAPGQLASARIVEYTAAAVRPFEEVKAEVTKRVQAAEALKLAKTEGEAKLKALQGGEAPAGFGDGLLTVSRLAPAGLSRKAVEAIFRAQLIKLPAYVGVEDDGGYMIYQVLSTKAGDGPEVAQRRTQLASSTDMAFTQQEFLAFTESLKARSNVKRIEAALSSAAETTKADPKADSKAAGSAAKP
jgi:peptidyl-prolyl cis-trans isomerase D